MMVLKVHRQDLGVGSCRVQVLEDEVEPCLQHCTQTCWFCRKTAGVQEGVRDKVLKRLVHRGQRSGSVVFEFCGPCVFLEMMVEVLKLVRVISAARC